MSRHSIRRATAMVVTASLLASLVAVAIATPASAAKPTCRGLQATIVGTNGPDVLVGTARRDVIVGRGGNDVIDGRGGNDVICGGGGADRLIGRKGRDRLYGNAGPDRLFGGLGPDRLFGGVGNDVLAGQVGSDFLSGGPGTDTCYQGQGAGRHVSCERPVPRPPGTYQAFAARLDWHEAVAHCNSRGAYLVTINSAEEDALVFALEPDSWLGATDEAEEGTWRWVTGEPFVYTNWAEGEPNDAGGEDYATYSGHGAPVPDGVWNDVPLEEQGGLPFVCEYE